MLDVMRKHSRSFLIYVFFGIIIAVFVVNFGPQSAGCVTSGTSYAGSVAGKRVPVADFEYAQSVWGLRQRQGSEPQLVQLRQLVMDKLLARELLAGEAEKLGFKIPHKEIADMIFSGRYLALGQPRPLIRAEDGTFDYSRFSRYVRYYWGLTVKRFEVQQQRELLADKMRQYLTTTVQVSEDEVKTDWVFRNTKVKLAYVRFSPSEHQAEVSEDPQERRTWSKANAARISKYFTANKSSYSKLPAQLQLRLIELLFKADDTKAQAKAKALADKLHKRLAGGADFAKLARESSQHSSKSAGGLIGWRNASDPGIGKEASKAVAKLKKGQMTAVVAESDRFVIARVEDTRKGDLTLAQAEGEIARKLFAESKTKALATAAAEKFLARAKAGEKLADIFTVEGDLDEGDADKKKAADKKAADTKAADKKAADKKAADKKTAGKKTAGKKTAGKKTADTPADNKPARSEKKVLTTDLFTRNAVGLIPRLGISSDLTEDVFKLTAGKVVDHVVEIGKLLYIVKVVQRQDANMGEWTKRREDLVEAFANRKQSEFVGKYTFDVCKAAAKAGQIKVEPAVFFTRGYLEGQQKAGKKVTMPAYDTCKTLEPRPYPMF